MDKTAMLRALQADVNAWPQRVRDAGVTNAGGAAYVPVARNNAVLRTPDDPEATYRYMLETWKDSEDDSGSAGWHRIIRQAGPRLTWEWLMVDPDKPYAPLFDAVRETVRTALERDANSAYWFDEQRRREAVEDETADRRRRMGEEMRDGRRKRVSFPGLDGRR
jgi:hypothetical protein